MRSLLLTHFCFIFFLATDISLAAPIMYRVQQKKQMEEQQKQMQGMTPQQYQQYILFQEQQQGDHQAPAPPTYEQVVDQRNQAIAQSIRKSQNQTGITEAVGNTEAAPDNKSSGNQNQQLALNTGVGQQESAGAVNPSPANSQDVVDLAEVWKKLDKKSIIWNALDDDQAKLLTVTEFIGRYQKEGVKINESASHYVEMIDQLSQQNPQMLDRPFGELLQVLAIIDYDFDNGMDKDALAKQILGEAGYEANKKRFVQQQQQQQ